jgi:hypothetical protein
MVIPIKKCDTLSVITYNIYFRPLEMIEKRIKFINVFFTPSKILL